MAISKRLSTSEQIYEYTLNVTETIM